MDMKKFLLSGILAGIIIFIVWVIFSYTMPQILGYDATKLEGMRKMNDPLMMFFFLHPFVIGFAMALFYQYFGESIMGDYLVKGRIFGLLTWFVSSVPSAFIVYTSMDYPMGFTVSQVVGSFIYMLLAGIAIAKLDEIL